MSKRGNKVPCSLSSTLQVNMSNEVVHLDYLYLGESDLEQKYVQAVKDDLSGYCWLEPSSSASTEHVSELHAGWDRVFAAPSVWVFSRGVHFKNQTMRHLARTHRVVHPFTAAFSL